MNQIGDQDIEDEFHPVTIRVGDVSVSKRGVTKREMFAAMMLQGLITKNGPCGDWQKSAVILADKLIEELGK